MNVSEAALALGLSKQGVRKAILRRKLLANPVRRGERFEYEISEVEVARYRRIHNRPGHRRVEGQP